VRLDEPRWVMMRSLLLPGWGQLHNRAWFKALAIGGTECWILAGMLEDDRQLRRLRSESDRAAAGGDNEAYNAAVDAYNDRLEGLVTREWWLGGLLLYSMLDAYVDAHFRDFKVEFGYDRVLRDGSAPGGRARLSVGWGF
jgi:hypothetical protein